MCVTGEIESQEASARMNLTPAHKRVYELEDKVIDLEYNLNEKLVRDGLSSDKGSIKWKVEFYALLSFIWWVLAVVLFNISEYAVGDEI
ncbi:hypothetical protein ACFL1Z_07520 [Thermodesulfobacteriota bacterium]